jgi:hypothetical protein
MKKMGEHSSGSTSEFRWFQQLLGTFDCVDAFGSHESEVRGIEDRKPLEDVAFSERFGSDSAGSESRKGR